MIYHIFFIDLQPTDYYNSTNYKFYKGYYLGVRNYISVNKTNT